MPTCNDCKKEIPDKDFSEVHKICFGCAQKRKKGTQVAVFLFGLLFIMLPIISSFSNPVSIDLTFFIPIISGSLLILLFIPLLSFIMKQGFKPGAMDSGSQIAEPVGLDDEKTRRRTAFLLTLIGILGILIFEPIIRREVFSLLIKSNPLEYTLFIVNNNRGLILAPIIIISPGVFYMGWGCFSSGAKALKKTRNGGGYVIIFSFVLTAFLSAIEAVFIVKFGVTTPLFIYYLPLLIFAILSLIGGIIGIYEAGKFN